MSLRASYTDGWLAWYKSERAQLIRTKYFPVLANTNLIILLIIVVSLTMIEWMPCPTDKACYKQVNEKQTNK